MQYKLSLAYSYWGSLNLAPLVAHKLISVFSSMSFHTLQTKLPKGFVILPSGISLSRGLGQCLLLERFGHFSHSYLEHFNPSSSTVVRINQTKKLKCHFLSNQNTLSKKWSEVEKTQPENIRNQTLPSKITNLPRGIAQWGSLASVPEVSLSDVLFIFESEFHKVSIFSFLEDYKRGPTRTAASLRHHK